MKNRAARAAVAGATTIAALGLGAGQAAASTTAQVAGGTLQVTGDAGPDRISLAVDPAAPGSLIVDVGEDGTADFRFDRSTFSAIAVDGRGGDDDLRLGSGIGEPATLDGGGGDDTLIGGDGADILLGGPGNDFADGNRGADTAHLGSGSDRFAWDPGDGSDVVEGEGGTDRLDFNAANIGEHIGVTANGPRVRLTRDIGAVTMDLGGVEQLGLRALGGSDAIAIGDLGGTALKAADIDLGGDGAADAVTVDGTSGDDDVAVASATGATVVSGLAAQVAVSGADAGDAIAVRTLGGADRVSGGVGLAGPAAVNVDGGEGADRVTYRGSADADTIGITPTAAGAGVFTPGGGVLSSAAVEDVVVQGQGGDDRITASNGLAALTHLTLDGGAGDDTLLGGDGDDTLLGGGGNDFADGNRGADVAQLGSGDDTFQWDPGDGSDSVEGQGGHDQLAFNGANIAERFSVAADGSRVRLARDIGAVTMDLGGIERIALRTLAGADAVTIGDLRGTPTRFADIDLGSDGAADTVTTEGSDHPDHVAVTRSGAQVQVDGLHATTTISGSEIADTLRVATLGGNDRVAVAPDVGDVITPVVDLGDGQRP